MPEDAEPSIISVDSEDVEMKAAMARARETFPDFWAEVSKDYQRVIPALGMIQVKGYFYDEDDPNGGEHMWVGEVTFDGKMISGTLTSTPGHLDGFAEGDSVEFPLARLSDWLIVHKERAKGAHTVQILRARMTEDERAAHDSHYPFNFPPLDK